MLLKLSQTIKDALLDHKIIQVKLFNRFNLLIDENNTKSVRDKKQTERFAQCVLLISSLLFASIQQTDTSHSSVDPIPLNFIFV